MSPESVLHVRAGELTVRLVCDRPDLLPELEHRYRDFLAPLPAEPLLQVRLELPPSSKPFQDPTFDFEAGLLRFRHPDYVGWVDAAGEAFLRACTSSPDAAVEYFLRSAYAVLAFREGGLLVHAAGVVRGGKAYLFFGHSGSGKTTVARLSGGESVLNDDLILLMPDAEGWRAWSTPFSNPTQQAPKPGSALLAGLYRLVQSKDVRRELLPHARAAAELFSCLPVLPKNPALGSSLLDRVFQVLSTTPAYALHFLPDPSFWSVVDPTDQGHER